MACQATVKLVSADDYGAFRATSKQLVPKATRPPLAIRRASKSRIASTALAVIPALL
jgi:hypothetical protein